VCAEKAAAAQKEQEKLERIREAAANNVNKREAEYKVINEQLQKVNMKIHDVPADGNCLFSALAEQMKLSGRGQDYNWQILRALAGQYMSENSNDFIPFVDFPADEFPRYCEKVKVDPATWGSQLEIQAICSTLRVPVEVIAADAPPVLMGEEFASPDEHPLRVSFHKHAYTLGDHYNSVVPISMPVEETEPADEGDDGDVLDDSDH
jgi:OTU domain-containing protein 6